MSTYTQSSSKPTICPAKTKCLVAVPEETAIGGIVSKNLSGIVVNQSLFDSAKYLSGSSITGPSGCQEFVFPTNYLRGESLAPDLTGFQLYVRSKINIYSESDQNLETATINYLIERYDSGQGGWVGVASGFEKMFAKNSVSHDPSAEEDHWFNVRFAPVSIDANWVSSKFRIRFSCNSSISRVYYKTPNPLNNGVALTYNGISSISDPASFAFRVLSAVADEGQDFLGNSVRSLVFAANSKKATTVNNSQYWLSKPNPSKFGVENLYFDVSKYDKSAGATDTNQPVVIDSVFLDPITPNVYFHIYYSNDPNGPGVDDLSWENLMWTHVPKTFHATKAQNYILPTAISAKYIKIEFSHLRGQYYAAGNFQKPILYKKHPQWVFDYFIAEYENKRKRTYDPFIKGQITVNFDVYDLAFNYYKNDILQTQAGPIEIKDPTANQNDVVNLLTKKGDSNSNQIDSTTSKLISTAFNRFASHPAQYSVLNNAVDLSAQNLAQSSVGFDVTGFKLIAAQNYPIERMTKPVADFNTVSTFDREPLLFEANFPVMFFYVTCRHAYREAYAKFEDDKAYFAGVREVIFQREAHSSQYDSTMYTHITGENASGATYNDFVTRVHTDEESRPSYYWSAE